MTSRQFLLITLSSVSVVFLLIFSIFEVKRVPDLHWQENFTYHSVQPYGAWIFQSLIRRRYSHIPVLEHFKDTLISDIHSKKNLYILLSSEVSLDEAESEQLIAFAERGNDVLIITESLSTSSDDFEGFVMHEQGIRDTVIAIQYWWDSEATYRFTYYHQDLERPKPKHFNGLAAELNDYEDQLILATAQNDSIIVFAEWLVDTGSILLHTIPSVFSNLASKQSFYLNHFNRFFDQFSPEMVILDHMNFHLDSNRNSQSPLQFILNHKALRLAYYLLLFIVLSFIIFKAKRRQKIIPTLELNNNTSLEYVKTLSSLYKQQQQHKKLIYHLKSIFIHNIKKRYFLDYHDPGFVTHLARKSKVDLEEIQELVQEFSRAEKKLNVGDGHLTILHHKLEMFYKKSK
jgi:hypothetical protein